MKAPSYAAAGALMIASLEAAMQSWYQLGLAQGFADEAGSGRYELCVELLARANAARAMELARGWQQLSLGLQHHALADSFTAALACERRA